MRGRCLKLMLGFTPTFHCCFWLNLFLSLLTALTKTKHDVKKPHSLQHLNRFLGICEQWKFAYSRKVQRFAYTSRFWDYRIEGILGRKGKNNRPDLQIPVRWKEKHLLSYVKNPSTKPHCNIKNRNELFTKKLMRRFLFKAHVYNQFPYTEF